MDAAVSLTEGCIDRPLGHLHLSQAEPGGNSSGPDRGGGPRPRPVLAALYSWLPQR